MLFVFIYIYWCPTWIPYQMMFVSFNSSTTGVTNGSGTASLSEAPELIAVVRVAESLGWCVVVFCLSFCPFSFYCLPFDLRVLYLQTFLYKIKAPFLSLELLNYLLDSCSLRSFPKYSQQSHSVTKDDSCWKLYNEEALNSNPFNNLSLL
jgi:hypothetical protein